MATLTPITKSDLVEMGLNFVSVTVPVLPITVRKTGIMKTFLFTNKEEAKKKLSEMPALLIFDMEKVYGEKATQQNNKIPEDKFFVRLVEDISASQLKKIVDNARDPKDIIFHFDLDLTHF
jgi:hypothetical protein